MELGKVAVVLVHPEESRNIGAVCRALANSGMTDLRIVGNRPDYDDEKVRILAIHAAPLWERARFFESLDVATADCTLAVGTTRRRGKNRKGKLLFPEECAPLVNASTAHGGTVALVFGNERTGLTDQEFNVCTLGVTIPAAEQFASLNLSHAVQIMCYTLFRETTRGYGGYTPLPLSRIDLTVSCIADNLQKIGFFSVTGRTAMERFWRSLLSRAALSDSEARYIEKIFTKIAGLASKGT
ncbi:MAG: RNA methyltransferase [Treponema sp.]|nr:RNA methyltransferase [Treponema sp.]